LVSIVSLRFFFPFVGGRGGSGRSGPLDYESLVRVMQDSLALLRLEWWKEVWFHSVSMAFPSDSLLPLGSAVSFVKKGAWGLQKDLRVYKMWDYRIWQDWSLVVCTEGMTGNDSYFKVLYILVQFLISIIIS
jgi:hypothetical protein